MGRSVIIRFVFYLLAVSVFHSCDTSPSGTDASLLADYFPPLAVGDTVSWDYTDSTGRYRYGSVASGIMTWTVVTRKEEAGTTTLQITQLFTGAVTAYSGSSVRTEIQGLPSTLVVTEDPAHMITISGSPLAGQAWYAPPSARFQRFQPYAFSDTLMITTGQDSTVRTKRGVGVIGFDLKYYYDSYRVTHYERRISHRPPDTVRVDPLVWGDFFPPFHVGDIAMWDLSSQYSSVSGPGYSVKGIMRWDVTRVTSGAGGTTTEISQTLNGTLTTWQFNSTWQQEVIPITNLTTLATITEGTDHAITLRIPIAVIRGLPGGMAEMTYGTSRFGYNNTGDDLVTSGTIPGASGTITMVRNAGPRLVTYRETGMSYNEAIMTRRQIY